MEEANMHAFVIAWRSLCSCINPTWFVKNKEEPGKEGKDGVISGKSKHPAAEVHCQLCWMWQNHHTAEICAGGQKIFQMQNRVMKLFFF